MSVLENLQNKLEQCISEHQIPGASVTVYQNGKYTQAVAGTINLNTGQPVLPETIFMIGSITKVLTATLFMQLVDEGSVNLNESATIYLPEVKVEGVKLKNEITVAMLLNHTSGIDGDYFIATGNNDDGLKKYIEAMTEIEYMHPPGKMRAYNNAAYNMLGRIIEKLRGKPFYQVLREELFEKIGITDDVLQHSEFLRYSAAIGHVKDPKTEKIQLSKITAGEFNQLAMGSLVSMSSLSLAKIGRFYLNDGVTDDGERLVSAESLAYLKSNTDGAINFNGSKVWASYQGSDMILFNHYGGTSGQNSWLGILPEKDLAIAVLTNYQSGAFEIELNLLPEVFEELGGFVMGSPAVASDQDNINVNPEKYIGKYSRHLMDIEIRSSEVQENDNLMEIKIVDKEGELNPGAKEWYPLQPVSNTDFEVVGQTLLPIPMVIHFYKFEEMEYPVLDFFSRPHKRC